MKKKYLVLSLIVLVVALGCIFIFSSNKTPAINATDITIYACDASDTYEDKIASYEEEFNTKYASEYQLSVTDASSVTYEVTKGDSVEVSSTGLVTIATADDGKTYNFGESEITVTAGKETFVVHVNAVDAISTIADKIMDDYIAENITGKDLTDLEKLNKICDFVSGFGSTTTSSPKLALFLGEGGSSYASATIITDIADKVGLEGQGTHRNGTVDTIDSAPYNALVKVTDGTVYEIEMSVSETTPRDYVANVCEYVS